MGTCGSPSAGWQLFTYRMSLQGLVVLLFGRDVLVPGAVSSVCLLMGYAVVIVQQEL